MKTNKQAAVLAYGRAIQRKKQAELRGYSSIAEEYQLTADIFLTALAAHDAGVQLTRTVGTLDNKSEKEHKSMLTFPVVVIIILLALALTACACFCFSGA